MAQPDNTNEIVRVDLGARSYDIVIGTDLIGDAATYISPLLKRPRTVTVTDDNVATHQLPAFEKGLAAKGIDNNTIILPAGEKTKNLGDLEKLLDQLLDLKVERSDVIIAFGGGVVGDLTGFAASILRRGVDVIQVPTSLLSQVDSSVGGKTGVNTRHGKNLVGSFYQPKLVLIDVTALETLSPREFLAGYAEVVKYGLIDDLEFFEWLEANDQAIAHGDTKARIYAIRKSCEAKARIVAEDEKEHGARALLNLGHTFGHALEAAVKYDSARLVHGEGVAIGMALAFDLSAKMGLCAQEDAQRIRAHFEKLGAMTSIRSITGDGFSADELIGHMAQDKKVEAGQMTFVLARGIGKSFTTKDVILDDVKHVLINDGAGS